MTRSKAGLGATALLLLTGCVRHVVYHTPPPPRAERPSPPPPPSPPPDADVADPTPFREPLRPYGLWVWHDPYGWVWVPRVAPGWRPYCVGRWVYTDEHGWLWASDEPWGWAVYHYGRWTFDNEYGWTWVPGAVWGPAWVAWRGGAGFVGWAPLPPAVGFAAGVGPNFAHFDVSVGIPPPAWVFVPETAILAPRIREEIVLPARNVTIIKTTQNVTNITVVNNRIVNVGLPPQRIEQATGRPVPRRRVQEIGSAGELAGSPEGEDTVRVFRPPVAKAKRRGPAPAKKSDRDEPGPEPAAEEEELFRRHEAEHRALDANDAQATETLEEQHRREKANPPPGVGPEELQKRHKEELRAKHEQEERERQIQERRHAREEGKHKDRDSGPPERGAGKDAPTSKPAKKKKKE